MVDEARVLALLDRIEEELGHLRRLGRRGDALLEDRTALSAVKYDFVVAIEAAIDVAQHILASQRLRVPDSFADSFSALGAAGFVPVELVPALGRMAGFRNLLVHGYAVVDDRRVLEVLQNDLGDLEAFRRAVAAAVGRTSG